MAAFEALHCCLVLPSIAKGPSPARLSPQSSSSAAPSSRLPAPLPA
eukprot:CAMPEP_0204107496 /NCGR_PEP_ID=MMETSP0361-20130328/168_1 /ASSEMBLY_ACC=CAM_ASM_000343 /TAXON_ID=268821 /ORGANISM="Scrippsiella Hangoei, Strain SHTV-5" /LENGTH=45 /DNA_ID= /DNA_START= /DNA_END= /DNA_ORIENTATION=